MPAGQNDALKLADMVLDINRTETLLADRLSNQIYKYDKEIKRSQWLQIHLIRA